MRRMVYFALGFALACLAGTYLGWSWTAAAAGLVGSLLLGKGLKWKRAGAVLLGTALGMAWFGAYSLGYLNRAQSLHEKTLDAVIRTEDYSWETDYGRAVEGRIFLGKRSYGVRVYLESGEEIGPGQTLSGTFRFRITTPDAMEGTYYSGKGIFLVAYQRGSLRIGTAEPDWRDSFAAMRRRIDLALKASIPADARPFARALLLGDGGDLGYQVQTDLTVSGVRHVVSVSGLHVSILFGLLSTISFRKKWLLALLGYPGLFLFAALAGFASPVVRACIMSGLMLTALLADREYDGPSALAFAVLMMTLANPLVVGSVSFQLSVLSVAGIFLFHQRIYQWILGYFGDGKDLWAGLKRSAAASVSISVSAMILTVPLCAWYFGTVSLISVVTNLLTLWLITLVFYGVIGVSLLYPLSVSAAGMLGQALAWPVRLVLKVVGLLAKLPMAAVYTANVYVVFWLVFVYVLLGVFLVMRQKRPGMLLCCAVLSLCLAQMAGWTEPMLDDVRFTMLNVGQGQCILVQCEGKTFLVDCGGDEGEPADLAAQTLLSMGIGQLDGVIVTHLDSDHAGSVAALLSRVDTQLLILPAEHTDLGQATAGEVIYAAEDLEIRTGNSRIRIFAPTFPGNSNEKSLCILFDTEKCDILVTGDRNGFGERMLLRRADVPEVDILVAGHHGAQSSTCQELLDAVKPETVCISVGTENSYGHPAPKLLQRLAEAGCTVYRTDRDGTITIRR